MAAGELSCVAVALFAFWAVGRATSGDDSAVINSDVNDGFSAIGLAWMLSLLGMLGAIALAIDVLRGASRNVPIAIAALAIGASQVTLGGPVAIVIIGTAVVASLGLSMTVRAAQMRPRTA